MDEVHFDAIDISFFSSKLARKKVNFNGEMVELIEIGLVFTPVIVVEPMVSEFLHVAKTGTHCPAAIFCLIWPAGLLQPCPKIVKNALWNRNGKRCDIFHNS